MTMDRYQTLIASLDDLDRAIENAVDALRGLDYAGPTSVRQINGRVDDLLVDLQKIDAARQRLMGRSSDAQRTGQGQIHGPQELAGQEVRSDGR